jgi:hypothetical protein
MSTPLKSEPRRVVVPGNEPWNSIVDGIRSRAGFTLQSASDAERSTTPKATQRLVVGNLKDLRHHTPALLESLVSIQLATRRPISPQPNAFYMDNDMESERVSTYLTMHFIVWIPETGISQFRKPVPLFKGTCGSAGRNRVAG